MVTSFLAFPGVAKHFAGFGESPADGGFCAVGDGCDICRTEALEIAEDENCSIGFGEFKEYALDLDGDFVAAGCGRRRGVGEPFFGPRGEE
jgi:hypothetical protein